MLYHVSSKTGLTTIQPHISTHKKEYVYALKNMVTGLLFGAKKDDFDLLIDECETGTPCVYECYPHALEKIYQGKSCSVYVVDDNGFQRGLTSWEPELVCESEVQVLHEMVIEDIYRQLLKEEKDGNLILHRYERNDSYRKMIASHVVDRLIRFDIDLDSVIEKDIRFATHYKDIVQALSRLMDGHLLA